MTPDSCLARSEQGSDAGCPGRAPEDSGAGTIRTGTARVPDTFEVHITRTLQPRDATTPPTAAVHAANKAAMPARPGLRLEAMQFSSRSGLAYLDNHRRVQYHVGASPRSPTAHSRARNDLHPGQRSGSSPASGWRGEQTVKSQRLGLAAQKTEPNARTNGSEQTELKSLDG